MAGWRDEDGRTARERRDEQRSTAHANFADRVRNRPLSLVRPILGAVFIAILVLALLNFYG